MRYQNCSKADAADAGHPDDADVFLEDEIGINRHDDIGEAQKGIGVAKFNPGENDEMGCHGDDEGAKPQEDKGVNGCLQGKVPDALALFGETADSVHAFFEHDLRRRVGEHGEEDEGNIF